jgi:NADH-quinone oxidoreductase subunit M
VTAAALFCLTGMLESRGNGLRSVEDFGGLRSVAPVFCGFTGIVAFASLGLPGLNGFVSEFLILKGAFALTPWAAAGSAAGLLVTAVFLLTMMQRVFHGPLHPRWAAFPDLSLAERLLVFPAIVLMFAIGVFPQFLLEMLGATVRRMVEHLGV